MYAKFEQALAAAVASRNIAGAVAVTVDRNGQTYRHSAGVRSADGPALMSLDTVFWLASMTKAITSVAALQLVEQGRLRLDSDLATVIPEFAGLQVLEGFDPDGTPRLRAPKRVVTLRHLLTHMAGFGYSFIHPQIPQWQAAVGAGDPSSGARSAMVQPLLFDPGDAWAYGISTDWVGVAVEAASGQKLDAYFRDHILAPLGMIDTGFSPGPQQQSRKAGVHVHGEDGAVTPFPFGMPAAPEVWSGGGGLYGTAPDYGRFVQMLLNGGILDGARILQTETTALLSGVQTGDYRAGAFTSCAPMLSNDFDVYPGMRTGHGLATMITPEATAEGRNPGSLAWAGLANTYYWVDPTAGIGGVLMTQLLPFGDREVLGLLSALERGAYRST